jgi:hypothetical protein
VIKPESPAETTGSWFNWWPSPVVTSSAVLGAVVLAFFGFLMAVAGFILFESAAPVVGILCWAAAVLCGWAAFRVSRTVR